MQYPFLSTGQLYRNSEIPSYKPVKKNAWVQLKGKNIELQNSLIPGGYTSTGEILYIGRKIHMGVMTPGKIHPSHDCLYVSYGGYEYSYKHNYEILVSRGPSEWLSETKGKYFYHDMVLKKKFVPKLSMYIKPPYFAA